MIHINPGRILKRLLLWVVLPGIVLFFHFTRFNYIPVQVTVGSCQMDYTSPLSYKPRVSPLQSEAFEIKGWDMLLCYGQPSARGRKVMGHLVEYGSLWRFGANEPTRFYTTADVNLGGLDIPKGRYSLYAIPGKRKWEIFVSRSISHWGNDISERVREQEIGSFDIVPEFILPEVEALTFFVDQRQVNPSNSYEKTYTLVFEWENTRLSIPIKNLEVEDKSEKSIHRMINEHSY